MFSLSGFSPINLTPFRIYPETEYLDNLAQLAAYRYAMAHARVEAIQRRHRLEQSAFQIYLNPVHPSYIPSHHECGYTRGVEDLTYSIWGEEERRRAILARGREVQRARALAEAAVTEEAARRARARLQAQQARQQDALLAILGLVADFTPSQSFPTTPQVAPRTSYMSLPFQFVPTASHTSETAPIDRKGKGKAVDVPAEVPIPAPVHTPVKVPSFKDELEARIHTETDPEVQESLLLLYSGLFETPRGSSPAPVAGPSMSKHERTKLAATEPTVTSFQVTVEGPPSKDAKSQSSTAQPSTQSEEASAHCLSLTQITEVEDALRKLESNFAFPDHLDFVDPLSTDADARSAASSETDVALAYTPNNTPLHAYEHMLNQLLTRLDAVESNGDDKVRGRRREVVREVERALEAVDRRVEESREQSRERARRAALDDVDIDVPIQSEAAGTPEVMVLDAPVAVPSVQDETVVETTPAVEATSVSEGASVVNSTTAVEDTQAADEISTVDQILNIGIAEPVQTASFSGSSEVAPILDVVTGPTYTGSHSADSESTVGDPSPASFLDPPMPESGGNSPTIGQPTQPADANFFAATDNEDDGLGEYHVLEPITEDELISAVPEITAFLSEPETSPSADDVPSTSEPVEVSSASSHSIPLVPAPEPISSIASSETDATFVTAGSEQVPPSASDDTAFFFTAEPTTPVTATARITRTPSSSSESSTGAEGTFLLSSTPLTEHSKVKRSTPDKDELEIISKDELEVARNESDWSDVGSDA